PARGRATRSRAREHHLADVDLRLLTGEGRRSGLHPNVMIHGDKARAVVAGRGARRHEQSERAEWPEISVHGSSFADQLFELEVRALHEVLPLLDVGVEESYEVRLVVLEERDADFRQIGTRLGLLEHALDVARDTRA